MEIQIKQLIIPVFSELTVIKERVKYILFLVISAMEKNKSGNTGEVFDGGKRQTGCQGSFLKIVTLKPSKACCGVLRGKFARQV